MVEKAIYAVLPDSSKEDCSHAVSKTATDHTKDGHLQQLLCKEETLLLGLLYQQTKKENRLNHQQLLNRCHNV